MFYDHHQELKRLLMDLAVRNLSHILWESLNIYYAMFRDDFDIIHYSTFELVLLVSTAIFSDVCLLDVSHIH